MTISEFFTAHKCDDNEKRALIEHLAFIRSQHTLMLLDDYGLSREKINNRARRKNKK